MKGECVQALHMLAPSILLSYIRVCDDKYYLQKRNTELVEENRRLKQDINAKSDIPDFETMFIHNKNKKEK
jgi:hypothetical protein